MILEVELKTTVAVECMTDEVVGMADVIDVARREVHGLCRMTGVWLDLFGEPSAFSVTTNGLIKV